MLKFERVLPKGSLAGCAAGGGAEAVKPFCSSVDRSATPAEADRCDLLFADFDLAVLTLQDGDTVESAGVYRDLLLLFIGQRGTNRRSSSSPFVSAWLRAS